MISRFLHFMKRLQAGIQKPIFRSSKKTCKGLHQWTTIGAVLPKGDHNRLKLLCKENSIAPLNSLVKGNLFCAKCGQIAHYNINLNVENLIINLRAQDS